MNEAESYFDESHTVLGIAAEKGNLEILKLLLEKGTNVNVNMPNNFGRTPLWLASAHGHINVVRELLKQKGIDLDKDEDRAPYKTALLQAYAQYNQPNEREIVKLLVKAGAKAPPGLKEQIEQEERKERRDALTGVAIRLTNTIPTTTEEYVTRQVLGQTVSNPQGEIIIRPLTKEIGSYLGGKRKTKKHKRKH